MNASKTRTRRTLLYLILKLKLQAVLACIQHSFFLNVEIPMHNFSYFQSFKFLVQLSPETINFSCSCNHYSFFEVCTFSLVFFCYESCASTTIKIGLQCCNYAYFALTPKRHQLRCIFVKTKRWNNYKTWISEVDFQTRIVHPLKLHYFCPISSYTKHTIFSEYFPKTCQSENKS